MNKYISILLFTLIAGAVKGQDELKVSAIPDSLKENAYSVVRYNTVEFSQQNMSNGYERCTYIVTILNSKGKDAADFVCFCDKFRDLKKFSGELYNANGQLIRKIKKNELKSTEYSAELASDSKMYYFECSTPSYPVTVKYEWEVKHQNGIIGFPVFMPQDDFNQSVETAEYKLLFPGETPFKHKALRMQDSPVQEASGKTVGYKWTIKNMPALETESFGPSLMSLVPILYATPTHFMYDGTEGDITDWQSFGNWQYELLKGRDALPPNIKQKLAEITKDAKTDKEKVKSVYNYLAETTRYVSIQLGIGGLQPMPATEVASTGFSDCKGLSNYTAAMLKELGIPSSYTVISTRNKRLIKDFATANQMNHVILQVPLPGDTLWLECTNAQLPFGYVHSDIAGNDALLIKETGGEIYRLPTYSDSLNLEKNKIALSLSKEGQVSGKVDFKSYLFQYEDKSGFTRITPKEQIDYLRKEIRVPQAKVNNVAFTEDKSEFPSIHIQYEVNSDQYGSKTGNRLFIPTNPFRSGFGKLSNKERKHDIYIRYGYQDSDSISFRIPENYTVEALPKPVMLNGKYGTFISLALVKDQEITIIQRLAMRRGQYKVSEYPAFVDFCKGVTNAYEGKIILKRKD